MKIINVQRAIPVIIICKGLNAVFCLWVGLKALIFIECSCISGLEKRFHGGKLNMDFLKKTLTPIL